MKKSFYVAMIAMAVVWAVLYVISEDNVQRDIFPNRRDPKSLHNDFYMPKSCVEAPDHYAETEVTPLKDCCYPTFVLELYRPFPATHGGCMVFIVTSAVVFIGGLSILLKTTEKSGVNTFLAMLGLLSTCMVIRSLERGNPIFLAATGVYVFLAWYDSDVRWKRLSAAVALAFAGVTKISPALFGLLYFLYPRRGDGQFRGIDWTSIMVCTSCAVGFFFIPFFVDGKGYVDIGKWISNATLNAREYTTFWGLPYFWSISSAFRRLFPLSRDMLSLVTQLAGLACLVMVLLPRGRMGLKLSYSDKLFFLVVSIFFIVRNNQYYTGLYLFPPMVVWLNEVDIFHWIRTRPVTTWIQLALWSALLMPIQFPLGIGTANSLISVVSFLLIVLIRFFLCFEVSHESAD